MKSRANEEKMADDMLALELLAGSPNGKNPKHFSRGEKKLRAALARRIRDQMGGYTGELLALAIDPFSGSTWPGMKPTAKLKFVRQGRPSSLLTERRVVAFIRAQIGKSNNPEASLDSYLNAAETAFGLKRSRVHEIWHANEKRLSDAARARERAWAQERATLIDLSEK
jgi:hypothetical protein